ncbi:helix-turn-helix transcriptional regulator [Psychromicrobium sp. YIM B11713]|uniref:helix-turn-helix transcriptional regulator n=1 Tax=Psychromicrobium sp. YIM B11713 TaxID=3145233 RepID=UPI00374FCD60
MGTFLRKRRASLTPKDVGLAEYGSRRVPGLRREEVAMMAGVSVTYYTRLEQGQHLNASDSVIDSLARALALSEVERQHLYDLAGTKRKGISRPTSKPDFARPGTLRLIESMTDVPALLLGKRSEVLAWNELGHALVGSHLDFADPQEPASRPNLTRMLFLDPRTRDLYPQWRLEASRAVASLRLLSGRFSNDSQLAALVGELTLKSPEFATMWSEHPVDNCMSGMKILNHPRCGQLELDYEVLSMPDDSGHRLLTYTAVAGSSSETALKGLLSA